MSSRDIAALVEVRHDKVMERIERIAKKGVIVLPQIWEVPFVDASGRRRKARAYIFTAESKRDTFVVVAQLSPEVTGRLVDRWQELEQQQARPRSPAEILIAQGEAMLAVEREQTDQAERIARLEQRVDWMGSDTGYRTITAYMKQNGIRLPISESRQRGIAAAKLARERGERIGNIPDERFGSVNSYPIDVLDEVFSLAG
ncbi:Rha family transcriptional regulator [Thiorhodovibrio frisius]|nr:Rha family transcriptional regulator [Thiorhodovibrio frisius]WPL22964.1 putative phage-encoded protein [Thiorhodovibrio frisius]